MDTICNYDFPKYFRSRFNDNGVTDHRYVFLSVVLTDDNISVNSNICSQSSIVVDNNGTVMSDTKPRAKSVWRDSKTQQKFVLVELEFQVEKVWFVNQPGFTVHVVLDFAQ